MLPADTMRPDERAPAGGPAPALPRPRLARLHLGDPIADGFFTDPRFARLLALHRTVVLPQRARFAGRQGEGATSLIVKSGRLRALLVSDDDEFALGYIDAGSIVTADLADLFEAEENSVLLVGTPEASALFRTSLPALWERALDHQRRLARSLMALVQMLALEDVPARVGHFLHHSAAAMGQPTPRGVLVDLRLSHEAIAAMLGIRRPQVSSTLAALARDGVIELSGRGRVLILRPDALDDAAC
jgi:CRP/FNR family transcriptional regulator, carbon monoxide oxidation system transcription regulator